MVSRCNIQYFRKLLFGTGPIKPRIVDLGTRKLSRRSTKCRAKHGHLLTLLL